MHFFQKNFALACSFTSLLAVKGILVVYPALAATIIFVGQENMSWFHFNTVSL